MKIDIKIRCAPYSYKSTIFKIGENDPIRFYRGYSSNHFTFTNGKNHDWVIDFYNIKELRKLIRDNKI